MIEGEHYASQRVRAE